jgi:hypothetical protein
LTRSRPLISPCGLPAAVYLTDSHLSRFKRFGGEATAHRVVGIAGQWAAVKPDGGDFAARGVGVRDDVTSQVGGRDWGAIVVRLVNMTIGAAFLDHSNK